MNTTDKKARILCLDDEPGVVRSLKWLLQGQFDVTTCCDPHAALQLVQQTSFDVVISDQRMPGMTGTEFLARFKEIRPHAIRLLLTGYSDYAAVLQSVNESEVFRFIQKPWNNTELVLTVTEAAAIALNLPLEGSVNVSSAQEVSPSTAARPEGAVLVVDKDPAVHLDIREAAGTYVDVLWAASQHEATLVLGKQPVALIVTEARMGDVGTTGLINLVKRACPEVVTVVYTAERDASTISRLINEGQIYRFVSKPAGPGYLALTIRSALGRHRELMANPSLAARCKVQVASEDTLGEAGLIAASRKLTALPAGRARLSAASGPTWWNRLLS